MWTTVPKASVKGWTDVPKIVEGTTISVGSPIGLLLALTYSKTFIKDQWVRLPKSSIMGWTNVPKAT